MQPYQGGTIDVLVYSVHEVADVAALVHEAEVVAEGWVHDHIVGVCIESASERLSTALSISVHKRNQSAMSHTRPFC